MRARRPSFALLATLVAVPTGFDAVCLAVCWWQLKRTGACEVPE